MLAAALDEEVGAFLGRDPYERGKPFRGYRNGYHERRELTVGVGAVDVRVPRVAGVPAELAPTGYRSADRAALPAGLGGDPEAVRTPLPGRVGHRGFRAGVPRTGRGDHGAVGQRGGPVKERWADEYTTWQERPLGEHRYAYIWADGVYLGAGLERENSALLCILGAREDGTKELLAMQLGYRESTASWSEVLRDHRDRGLAAPLLAVGDGGLGLWAALREVFPATAHQRCWNHRVLNLLDKLPKRLQAEARGRLPARSPRQRPRSSASDCGPPTSRTWSARARPRRPTP